MSSYSVDKVVTFLKERDKERSLKCLQKQQFFNLDLQPNLQSDFHGRSNVINYQEHFQHISSF